MNILQINASARREGVPLDPRSPTRSSRACAPPHPDAASDACATWP